MSSKPQYFCPRIGVVDLRSISNLASILQNIDQYHGKYFQIFNLTNISIFSSTDKIKEQQTKFKWRGSPFSVTETIRILNKMDTFMRVNKGNTIIFCINNSDAYLFVKVIVREYAKICDWGTSWQVKNKLLSQQLKKFYNQITREQPYFSQNLISTYKSKLINAPPVKILSTFSISTSSFIPLIEIYQESRYNDFELVYTQDLNNELAQYYYNLNKPLEEDKFSIGKKHYDRKPQTKYLQKPVVICGDVKIICYSFNTLQKKKQFSLGFSTKNLIFSEELGPNQGILAFCYEDLFDKQTLTKDSLNNGHQITKIYDQKIQIYIKIENWCSEPQCTNQSQCQQCLQHCKRLNVRYNQVQSQLNKFHRQRTAQQVKQYFSLA